MAKDYNPDIVSVVDEEGKEHIFEELDRIETDRGCYVALLPVYDDSEEVLEGEDEVLLAEASVALRVAEAPEAVAQDKKGYI